MPGLCWGTVGRARFRGQCPTPPLSSVLRPFSFSPPADAGAVWPQVEPGSDLSGLEATACGPIIGTSGRGARAPERWDRVETGLGRAQGGKWDTTVGAGRWRAGQGDALCPPGPSVAVPRGIGSVGLVWTRQGCTASKAGPRLVHSERPPSQRLFQWSKPTGLPLAQGVCHAGDFVENCGFSYVSGDATDTLKSLLTG